MTKPKLTAAMQSVVDRMAAGWTLKYYVGPFYRNSITFFRAKETHRIAPPTFHAMLKRGVIDISKQDGRFNTLRLTPLGRELAKAEGA